MSEQQPIDVKKLTEALVGELEARGFVIASKAMVDSKFDEVQRLRKVLERLACRHVTSNPIWWQREAREALDTPHG